MDARRLRSWFRGLSLRQGMILLCASAALCGAAAVVRQRLQWKLDAESERARTLSERAAFAQRAAAAASSPKPDFVQRLPKTLSVDAVARTFHESAAGAGVTLTGATAEPHPQSAQALGRWTMTVSLRGPYAGLKQTLSEVMPRYPSAVVEAMRMRRDAGGSSNVELEIRLIFPLRFAADERTASGTGS